MVQRRWRENLVHRQKKEQRKSRGIKINVSSKTMKDIRITCSKCFKKNKQECLIAFKIKEEVDTYSHFLKQNNLLASFPIKIIKRSMVLMKVEKKWHKVHFDIERWFKKKQLRDVARGWERGGFYFTTDKKRKNYTEKPCLNDQTRNTQRN